jgi:hypothetical protein
VEGHPRSLEKHERGGAEHTLISMFSGGFEAAPAGRDLHEING